MSDIEKRESVDSGQNAPVQQVEAIDAHIDLEQVGIGPEKVSEGGENASENKGASLKSSNFSKKQTDNVSSSSSSFSVQNPPPKKIMRRQIEDKLKQDIKELNKQVKKVLKSPKTNAKELQVLVSRLRKLREYLKDLAYLTFDKMKHLWVKIVHHKEI